MEELAQEILRWAEGTPYLTLLYLGVSVATNLVAVWRSGRWGWTELWAWRERRCAARRAAEDRARQELALQVAILLNPEGKVTTGRVDLVVCAKCGGVGKIDSFATTCSAGGSHVMTPYHSDAVKTGDTQERCAICGRKAPKAKWNAEASDNKNHLSPGGVICAGTKTVAA